MIVALHAIPPVKMLVKKGVNHHVQMAAIEDARLLVVHLALMIAVVVVLKPAEQIALDIAGRIV